jgi:hypothetical protein
MATAPNQNTGEEIAGSATEHIESMQNCETGMALDLGPHLDESELESYSMGTLPEGRTPQFEEHLLACAQCQDRLLEMDQYINAVRSVSPRLREANRFDTWKQRLLEFLSPGKLVLVGAVAIAVVVAIGLNHTGLPQPPVTVTLVASRGVSDTADASAPAGRRLTLLIPLAEIPPAERYRVTAIDASGAVVWDQSYAPISGHLEVHLPQPLSAGSYFVRLYAVSGELLREFGLESN